MRHYALLTLTESLLCWVVPLCATGQTKVDFKHPVEHKEAQKFTFTRCSRTRRKNVTIHQFRKVSAGVDGILLYLRNLPALALFPRARFVFRADVVPMTLVCAGCTNDDAVQRRQETSLLASRYWETLLIIPTVSLSFSRHCDAISSLRLSLFQQMEPPTCLLARLPKGDSFHSSLNPQRLKIAPWRDMLKSFFVLRIRAKCIDYAAFTRRANLAREV